MMSESALKDLVESSGIPYKQNSRSYIFTCPRCGKKDKLYLLKSKTGRFVCFVCKEISNFQGRPEFALSELLGLPVPHVSELLYGNEFKFKPFEEISQLPLVEYFGPEDLVPDNIRNSIPTMTWPHHYYPIDHKHASRGLEYLKQRGVSLNIAQKYNIRYSPQLRRVAFPVEIEDRLIGWQARSVISTEYTNENGESFSIPKILGTPGLKRDLVLMFEKNLTGSKHAVVCEGPMDAIKADLCGGNVATMGKAVSDSQIEIIKNSGVKKVYLALDPDAANEVDRIVRHLNELELYHLLPTNGSKDLGDMSPEEVYKQFLRAPRITSGMSFVYLRY